MFQVPLTPEAHPILILCPQRSPQFLQYRLRRSPQELMFAKCISCPKCRSTVFACRNPFTAHHNPFLSPARTRRNREVKAAETGTPEALLYTDTRLPLPVMSRRFACVGIGRHNPLCSRLCGLPFYADATWA